MYNEFNNNEGRVSGNGMNSQNNSPNTNDSGNMNYSSTSSYGTDSTQTSADAQASANTGENGIYRMKFNNGESRTQTGGFNSYDGQNSYDSQNSHGSQNSYNSQNSYGSQNSYYQTNDYSYYQQPGNTKKTSRPSKKRKKGGAGRQLAKVVCFGLVFGLVAGGTMWGVNTLGNMATGGSGSANSQNTSDTGFTLGVVKTSSQGVENINGSDVSDVVEQAMPSIVSVNTVIEQETQDFFGRTYTQEGAGAGSGIIFSEADNKMYIITNYHVIENSTEVSVTFNDTTSADATVLGYDEDEDIAVLSVDMSQLSDDTKNAVKIAVLGDSDALRAGDGAIAIGNALGYGQSVTTGTISAVNREVKMTDGTKTMIQTDAAINEGNSGGALLNAKGEVIGINSAKLYGTTVEGMGYAIPINSAVETVNAIISGEHVNKTEDQQATLGILGGTVDETSKQMYGWPTGVYVSAVYESSAAQRAGLAAGDVIVGFNGQEITTMEELQEALEACNPGDEVTIDVRVPGEDYSYSEQRTLKTLLGSAAEIGDSISQQ